MCGIILSAGVYDVNIERVSLQFFLQFLFLLEVLLEILKFLLVKL
jgi:hypothetical protein